MGGNSRESRRALPFLPESLTSNSTIMKGYETTLRLYVPLLRELFKSDVHKGKQLCAIFLDNIDDLPKKEQKALRRTVALYYGHAREYPCTCYHCGAEQPTEEDYHYYESEES